MLQEPQLKKQLLGMVLIYLKGERLILMKFSGKIPKDIQEDYIPGYIIRYLRGKYDNKCQLCG